MNRIYVSGPGLVCCAGQNRESLYESCLLGNQSGIQGEPFPTGRIAWELPASQPVDHARTSRIIRIIDAALEQIRPVIEDAIAVYGPEKIGVCLGSCDNGSEASQLAHKAFLEKGAFPAGYQLRHQSAAFPAEYIARVFGLRGPVMTIATACASGASAMVRGAELIQSGRCGAVIAGGADIVSETVLLGFSALEAVSDSLTNPFSKNRKGINLGEGAAFFVLDTRDNSGIELLGAGESSDAYHMTAPGVDGNGPVRAMEAALLDAGIDATQVGYVNLHGTGTQLNDQAEAAAMRAVFGDAPPPASSTKPVMGHTLGAAGALEAAVCWSVLAEKKGLPVHCWDGVKDEALPFSPVIPSGQKTAGALTAAALPDVCMSNNFAFGGCNVSLILGYSR